jgi:hypothetical protein
MSKRCSDVVESRVEQAILDAESRRNATLTRDSEQPRRTKPFWATRGLDDDSVCRAGPPYRGVSRVVKRSTQESEPARLWRIREQGLLAAREAHFAACDESELLIKRAAFVRSVK